MKDTVTVGGHEYLIGEMPAFDQFHVARRIAPLLGSAIEAFAGAPLLGEIDLLALAVPGIMKSLQEMKDDDAEYVIRKCLSVVKRQDGNGWAKVMNSGGGFQYQDIKLKAMLLLAAEVIKENLSDFFPTGQSDSAEAK